ncbi:hypothetical protein AAWM_07846 [Aspergillus awamori]|uniref:Uncharacterized protein n=1 Tax=Aspergillus awamori TaxID=105351 RepID=A0A401L0E9_ASPAW|nr:hypothetical protein AAWM_07846 [Aspergillus awamori]
MEQDKKANNDFVPVYKRTVQVIVISMVIFFAPLSFTYFFDETHTSNLSDKVLAILVNPEFAYGEGSATLSDTNGGQMRIFLRNLTAMVSHTIAGSIAIGLGLPQFNTTLQFRYPVIHRFLGRLYILCALTISWSSRTFLADAMPKHEVFSGDLFAYMLWSLSHAVLGTLALAIYAIWNRDIGSHREFMVLNYAFMLGPFLVAASIFYLRQQHVRPSSSLLISSKFRLAAIASGLLGLLFQITKGPSFNGGPYPKAFLLALGPQLACYILLFVTLARAAKRRGDMGSYTAWITYQNGLISAPMWSVLSLYVARDILRCSEESLWMITVTEGFSQGLFSSFVIYVLATSKLANARRHTVKAD